jgi:hypothetical protein
MTLLPLTLAVSAQAITRSPDPAPVGDVLIPYYDVSGTLRTYLEESGRTAGERAELSARLGGGRWQASWNTLTGTLHDVYGDALRIHQGYLTDRDQVDRVARDWIAGQTDLLGARDEALALDMIANANRKWYVRYRQVVDGVPVHGAYVKLQITEDGRLIRFGSDFHPLTSVPAAALDAETARETARAGVPFDPSTDRIEDLGLLVVPVPASGRDETAVEYRLVHHLVVETREGPGRYITFVDATSGDVVRRVNDVHHVDLTGSVTGRVNEVSYCAPPQSDLGMEDLRVVVTDVGTGYTDESGDYVIDIPDGLPHPVEFQLRGLHVNTNNQAVGETDARIDVTGTPGVPLDIYWEDANSTAAERDCFYHTNRIYDYFKDLTGLTLGSFEGQTPCNVNIANSCNAFYVGGTINFYQEGGGCGNTGEISDVIYHEYGHGLDAFIGGFSTPELSEGIADIVATMMTNDSRIGRGFNLVSCNLVLRNCNNSLQYPQDLQGQSHADGRIICGFNWDVFLNFQTAGISDSRRDSLAAFTLLGSPETQPEYVTQWFIEDDDDGVLNNGTPHYDELCDAAMQHGYECPEIFEGVLINHTPFGDTANTTEPYEIVATIGTTVPGGMDSTTVYYSVDLGPFTAVGMTPTGNPSQFTAEIPAQPEGSLVRYYVLGSDVEGNRATSPADAPGIAHSVVVSSVGLSTHVDWDMETDAGWLVGDVSPQLPDDATAGIWERGDPVEVTVFISGFEVPATPEDDTTPDPGVNCWFTEQEVPGEQAGAHDVDGGKTTLRSPVFDLSGLQFVRLSYNRWFTNGLGANKSEDPFEVGLSTNGGLTYTLIEESLISASEWRETRVDLNGRVPFGDNMRLRFVARDNESPGFGPSIVEAAVDDVSLERWPIEAAAVGDDRLAGTVPTSFRLGQNNPNPFNPSTVIDYAVAASGRVELRIFNAAGQLVRSLVDATVEPGAYSVAWDGRNAAGVQMPTGVYYYRIDAPSFSETRKMVLLK